MGVARDASVGFGAIRLTFRLDTDAGGETLAQLNATTERYYVVLQTITGGPPVDVTVETV